MRQEHRESVSHQLHVRRQLRAVNHSTASDADKALSLELLEAMHKIADRKLVIDDVIAVHQSITSHGATSATTTTTFESALLELTGQVVIQQLQSTLHHLLAVGAFVPIARRYWKKQAKNPFQLLLLNAPDQILQPTEIIPVEEKIRALEDAYDQHLMNIGLVKQLILALQHSDQRRYHNLVYQAYSVLKHVYSTANLIRPQTEAGPATTAPVKQVMTLDNLPRDIVSTTVLLDYLKQLPVVQDMYKRGLEESLQLCQIPHFLRRRWWQLSLAAIGTICGVTYIFKNRNELGELLQTVQKGITDFVVDHMITPVNAIVGEVLLNKKASIQDPLALQDSKESLQRMLSDFIRDTNPSMPLETRNQLAQSMDMSVVSIQFEKEIPRALKNIVTGDIVRMMLIQIQFIKKELMVAMKAIDELMDANQLNLQMMATMPMFLAAGGVYAVLSRLSSNFVQFTSSRIYDDPATVATTMRYTLRDIERLLNMQNHAPTTSNAPVLQTLDSCGSSPAMGPTTPTLVPMNLNFGNGGTSLGVRDLGLLVVLLNELQSLYERNRGYFDEDEQKRFEEDMSDLIGDQMLVVQQLAVIQRMYHSHSFLMVPDSQSKWFH